MSSDSGRRIRSSVRLCANLRDWAGHIERSVPHELITQVGKYMTYICIAAILEVKENMLGQGSDAVFRGDDVNQLPDATALSLVQMSSDHPRDRRGGLVVHNSTIGVVQLGP